MQTARLLYHRIFHDQNNERANIDKQFELILFFTGQLTGRTLSVGNLNPEALDLARADDSAPNRFGETKILAILPECQPHRRYCATD